MARIVVRRLLAHGDHCINILKRHTAEINLLSRNDPVDHGVPKLKPLRGMRDRSLTVCQFGFGCWSLFRSRDTDFLSASTLSFR